MVPPEPGGGGANAAELEVFDLIKDQTPSHWVGLHHVGLPRHRSKPIAEIDFVVVAEPGVFCLEVKGGAPRCESGIWYAGSRRLKESPFLQAGSASQALRGVVHEVHPYTFGYGCVFPHAAFSVTGPEVLQDIVYDEPQHAREFAVYIERLGAYWRSRYPYSAALDKAAISRISATLRPNFKTVESLMPAVRRIKQRMLTLTEEQARAVEGFQAERQVVVRGGAGTGKTVIAAHEATRSSQQGFNVLLTCFNKALGLKLQQALAGTDVDVFHLDGLISDLIRDGETESEIPSDASREDEFEVFRPLAACSALERLGRVGVYDTVIVDEGQDLITVGMVDVLDSLIRGGIKEGSWRVFWDPLQNLFHSDVEPDLSLLISLGGAPVRYSLPTNCRNSAEIASHVEFLSGVEMTEVAFPAGAEVLDRDWDNEKAEEKALRAVLLELEGRGVGRDAIKILSPRVFERSVASTDLGNGLRVRDDSGSPTPADASQLSFSTIQSYKGLESDVVVLVDVDDLDSDRMRSLLYVGASRARALLVVIRSRATNSTFAKRVLARDKREADGDRRRPTIELS